MEFYSSTRGRRDVTIPQGSNPVHVDFNAKQASHVRSAAPAPPPPGAWKVSGLHTKRVQRALINGPHLPFPSSNFSVPFLTMNNSHFWMLGFV